MNTQPRVIIDMSLRELNGPDSDAVGETSLMRGWNRARRMPLRDIGLAEIRLLVSQETDLNILLPMAVAILRDEPLAVAELYEGDLLVATLRAALSPDATQSIASTYHMSRLYDSATRAIEALTAADAIDEVFDELRALSECVRARLSRETE